MIKINLIPKEILDKELQKQQAIQAGLVAGFFLLIVAGFSLGHYYKSARLERQLRESQDRLKKLEAIVAEVEELERTANAVRARLGVIVELVKARPLYPRFMEDLLRSLPSGVWLANLSTQNEGSNLKISVSAKSISNEDIAQWLRQLESSDRFVEPVLGPISVSGSGTEARTHTFTLTMKYIPSAPT
jgi:Tfp pilus assembly protein PilN